MKILAWPAFKTRYKNPYNWLLYQPMLKSGVRVEEFSLRQLLLGSHEVIHLHWPVETIVRHTSKEMALLRTITFLGLLYLAKVRGSTIVWTIHDERPHVLMYPQIADWCEKRLVDLVDGSIHLCEWSRKTVFNNHPRLERKTSFVIRHGHYRESYPNFTNQIEARERINIPFHHTVLLFIGYISPYKNVPLLIDVFQKLERKDTTLIIAGKPDNEKIASQIQEMVNQNINIRLHLRFIPDEEIQFFINSANLVILPFKKILNSGSLLLSLSFNKPVLVPDFGAIPEWYKIFGESWVKKYEGELTTEILRESLDNLGSEVGEKIAPVEALNWDYLAQQTVSAYKECMISSQNQL